MRKRVRSAGHRSVCKTASRGFEFRHQCAEIHITLRKKIALNVKGIVLCACEVFSLVLVVSDDAYTGKHDAVFGEIGIAGSKTIRSFYHRVLGVCRIPPACQLAVIVNIQAHAHKLRSPDKHLTIGQVVRLRAFRYRYTPMQSVRRELLRHPALCAGIGDYLIQCCRIGKLSIIGSVELRHAVISRYFDAPELARRAVHRVIADRHCLRCRAR